MKTEKSEVKCQISLEIYQVTNIYQNPDQKTLNTTFLIRSIMPKLKLTCPECCYATLRKVGKYKWGCEKCGTTFNLAKMRNSLDALTGRLLPGEFISKLLGDATPQDADEFSERDYKWVGKHGFLYAADCGNDWWAVLKGQTTTKKS